MLRREDRSAWGWVPLALLFACAGAVAPVGGAAQEPARDSTARAVAPADSAGPAGDTVGEDSATGRRPVAQLDAIDVIYSILGRKRRAEPADSARHGRRITKAILPIIGNNPSYGTYYGASFVLGGWFGDPATTGVSSSTLSAFHTTEGYTGVTLRSSIYFANNRSLWKADWRYFDAGQATYGLGPATMGQGRYPMAFVLYRLHQTYYRRTRTRGLYVGLGWFFDRWAEIRDARAPEATPTPYEQYTAGASPTRTTSSGISFEILHDSRDNAINATRGVYWNAALRSYVEWLGSDRNWQSLWNEFRLYPALSRDRRHRLAFWNYFWFSFGPAPYLDLPASSWDMNGRASRGYLQGRIRGQNQVYTEVEYRFPLTRNGLFGGVAFANFMATTIPGRGNFGKLDPGYGLGVRLKFDKRTATNVGMDYARDRYGNGHLFFSMQEAF